MSGTSGAFPFLRVPLTAWLTYKIRSDVVLKLPKLVRSTAYILPRISDQRRFARFCVPLEGKIARRGSAKLHKPGGFKCRSANIEFALQRSIRKTIQLSQPYTLAYLCCRGGCFCRTNSEHSARACLNRPIELYTLAA